MLALQRRNKTLLIISIIFLMYYIQHLISFRLGMNFEESRDANSYLLAMQGEVPYKDFEWFYGPFSFFIYPFIMKIFGVNLIVLRLGYIIFASLVIPLAFFLARKIMPEFWAGIAAFLSVIFFDVPYYTYNHVFVVLGELGYLLMIIRFTKTKKNSNLFWAGVFTSVTILTKPLLPGAVLVTASIIFLIIFNDKFVLRKLFKNCSIYIAGCISLILFYLTNFHFQIIASKVNLLNFFTSQWPLLFSDQSTTKLNLNIFHLLHKRLAGVFPIQQILSLSSLSDLKNILVSSLDNFIFILPFIVPIIILFLYFFSSKFSLNLSKKIYSDKKLLFIFIIFSMLISSESFLVTHIYGRAFTIQVSFILLVYLFYLIKHFYRTRRIFISLSITLFLFYVSFLHFFRYPYSMLKKYTAPLNLERAKGILVTWDEKKLYESLNSYLALNFKNDDKMVVVGYYPQFYFLTGKNNAFSDEEYIFLRLDTQLAFLTQKEETKPLITLENKIISRIERESPEILLTVSDNYSDRLHFIAPGLRNYIEEKYFLDRVFGPADVFGLGGSPSWLNLYRRRAF